MGVSIWMLKAWVFFFVEVKQERFKELTPEESLIAIKARVRKCSGGAVCTDFC